MKPRYYGVIDDQIIRVFRTRADAMRWQSLRPEAVIVPIVQRDPMDGVGPAVF